MRQINEIKKEINIVNDRISSKKLLLFSHPKDLGLKMSIESFEKRKEDLMFELEQAYLKRDVNMKTIKFEKHYSKLDDKEFTTIRTGRKDILDEIVKIKSPETEFLAKCVNIKYVKMSNINSDLLKKDTDTKYASYAMNELRQYYPKLDWGAYVYVYYFEKE